jgi:hypothetical protein
MQPEVKAIAAVQDNLPEAVKAGIMAMVRAATKRGAGCPSSL